MSKVIQVDAILKPCPFCGGGDLEFLDYTENLYGFWDYKIRCRVCRAYMDSPPTSHVSGFGDGVWRQTRNDETKAKAKRELILNWNRRVIDNTDVVPKSEVDSEIKVWQELYADTVSKWEEAYEELEIKLENTKAEVAREIFEEIYEDCFDQFGHIDYETLSKLRKKYTEEIDNDD